jgi:hypothetical protein
LGIVTDIFPFPANAGQDAVLTAMKDVHFTVVLITAELLI